eukprot:TRINITY_DN10566_c0_g1_i1.p1 TRINITY_DN10566_c0_g1~~TRINITY_DN10566_c0_g1_i1.p1  ORF type:complete len:675 (+),score=132.39 TRINITY_DN10566_c0_g1_i1:193-2217(+)
MTEVQDATKLWKADPEVMLQAVRVHNSVLRDGLVRHRGYEVRTECESFFASFGDAARAFQWCCDVQNRLLRAEWPEALLQSPHASEVQTDGRSIWRGLRVRMGVHCGAPLSDVDPTTKRVSYYGPVVEVVLKVTGLGCGGEILMSGTAYQALPQPLRQQASFDYLGERTLRGAGSCTVWSAVPRSLQGREFGRARDLKAAEAKVRQLQQEGLQNKAMTPINRDGLKELEEQLDRAGRGVTESCQLGESAREVLSTGKSALSRALSKLRSVGALGGGAEEVAEEITIVIEQVSEALDKASHGSRAADAARSALHRVGALAEPLVMAAAKRIIDAGGSSKRGSHIPSPGRSAGGFDTPKHDDDDTADFGAGVLSGEVRRMIGSIRRGTKKKSQADVHDSEATGVRLQRGVAGCHRLARCFHHLLGLFVAGLEGDLEKERITDEDFVARFVKELERVHPEDKRQRRTARAAFSETMKLALENEEDEERVHATGNYLVLLRSVPALLCKSFNVLRSYLHRSRVRDRQRGGGFFNPSGGRHRGGTFSSTSRPMLAGAGTGTGTSPLHSPSETPLERPRTRSISVVAKMQRALSLSGPRTVSGMSPVLRAASATDDPVELSSPQEETPQPSPDEGPARPATAEPQGKVVDAFGAALGASGSHSILRVGSAGPRRSVHILA